MSSAHILVVARNDETGEIRLPLGDVTLYGGGGERGVLLAAAKQFGPEWSLNLYVRSGSSHPGLKLEKPDKTG